MSYCRRGGAGRARSVRADTTLVSRAQGLGVKKHHVVLGLASQPETQRNSRGSPARKHSGHSVPGKKKALSRKQFGQRYSLECPMISHEFSVFCKKYLQPWIRNPFNLGPSLGCCPGSGPGSRGHSHSASSLAGAGAPPVWHSQVAVVASWECSVHHRQGEAPPRERRQINVGFSMRGETFNQSGLSMREIIIIIVIMIMMMMMMM